MTRMPAPLSAFNPPVLAGIGIAVVAGILLSAGWIWLRKPDYVPTMAPTPITTAQGAKLYVQLREVTIAEWNRCHDDNACTLALRAPQGHQGRDFPATGLNWVDVNEYLTWAKARSGLDLRLPTAEEWSLMAASVMPEKPDPIFTDPDLTWASAYLTEGLVPRRLKPSGSFATTAEGIEDLDGNVWEWTQDCYSGASDIEAQNTDACPAFVVAGEHAAVIPFLVRDPARGGCAVGSPPPHLGMRLVSNSPVPRS